MMHHAVTKICYNNDYGDWEILFRWKMGSCLKKPDPQQRKKDITKPFKDLPLHTPTHGGKHP